MIELSDKEFEQIVADAMDAIPEHYALRLNNVGFVVESDPSLEQKQQLHLVDGVTLYGLYQGIPLTQRSNNYSGVLPDKITIFKNPILSQSVTKEDVIRQVKK